MTEKNGKCLIVAVFSVSFQQQLQEEAGAFQNHVQSFFTADQRSRSQPRPEKPERRNEGEDDRRSRAVTPGRSLLGEISNNLKPVKPRSSVVAPDTSTKACDFTKHFKVITFCYICFRLYFKDCMVKYL